VAAQIKPGSSLDRFVRDVRESVEQSSTMPELLRRVSSQMRQALKDPKLLDAVEMGIVYRDADYLFQINAQEHDPGYHTPVHDHGECWAVYGVYEGTMRMTRYERLDDGSDGDYAELRGTGDFDVAAGSADVIAPWGVHEVENRTDTPTRSFVIRSRALNEVWRNRFDMKNKRVERIRATRAAGD
jgi:predicted metal-dependent enzyme (double-stranded beta helix superfamily)